MSLSDKVGQLFLSDVSTCSILWALRPGVVVFTGKLPAMEVQRRVQQLRACAQSTGLPLLLFAMDYEGQYVYHFKGGVTILPTAAALGAVQDPDVVREAARAIGQELRYWGIDVVLAPVADVLTNPDNEVIGGHGRSFGSDPNLVAQNVVAMVQGYLEAGIIPVVKHFPGHGNVAADSHRTLPRDEVPWETFVNLHLVPFREAVQAGVPAVMMAHIAFPTFDVTQRPASLSPYMVQLLRQELGFQGVVLTDSLGMAAVAQSAGSLPEAAVQAIQAGVDMLIVPDATRALEAKRRIEQAVLQGEIPRARLDEAVLRILTLKHLMASQGPVEPPNMEANQQMAFHLGYRSVTLVKDDAGWVPLAPSIQRVLVVMPRDPRWYTIVQQGFEAQNREVRLLLYSGITAKTPIPERGYLTQVPALLQTQYDAAVLCTWNAHHRWRNYQDDFQIQLVRRTVQAGRSLGKPVVVVALKFPLDIVDFPDVPTYLATYGTTPGQMQGLTDVLLGLAEPQGEWPFAPLWPGDAGGELYE